MIVFKTFLKILNKYKIPIILFNVMLIAFTSINFNYNSNESTQSFEEDKPDILIINKDENSKISNNLVEYLYDNSNKKDIELNDEAINDALFYRDVNYIVYIPENYSKDFKNGLNPKIDIKSTGDSSASYAEMLLTKYLKVANIYQSTIKNEDEMIQKINETLKNDIEVVKANKNDTVTLSKATFYYNFMNYTILAGVVYVCSLILSTFNEEKVRKRITTSSMNYKKHNLILIFGVILLSFVLWAISVLLSFILIGDGMRSYHGVIYILNSFLFTICTVPLAFIISNLTKSKEAINGVINVVALGSSFLCGSFVPVELLPDFVLKIAHVLPSYWYTNSNELIKKMEEFNLESIKPIIQNGFVILVFTLVFIILANLIAKKKRKIA